MNPFAVLNPVVDLVIIHETVLYCMFMFMIFNPKYVRSGCSNFNSVQSMRHRSKPKYALACFCTSWNKTEYLDIHVVV